MKEKIKTIFEKSLIFLSNLFDSGDFKKITYAIFSSISIFVFISIGFAVFVISLAKLFKDVIFFFTGSLVTSYIITTFIFSSLIVAISLGIIISVFSKFQIKK